MLYISTLVPLLLSICLAMYIIPRILVVSTKKNLNLPPRHTDKGRRPVPRLGGVSLFPIIVICVGVAVVSCLMQDKHLLLLEENNGTFVQYMFAIAGLTTMYLLGVMDDLIGVSLSWKLIIEFLAALLIPLSGLWLDQLHGLLGIYELPYFLGMPFTVLTVMFIANTIPMLDDVDGLASGMAMIAFSVLGVLSFIANQPFFTLPDGIIMVCFGTLLIPMFDVLRVAVMRIVNHVSVFTRDNNHIHHRLMMGGMGAVGVLVTIIAVTSFFILLNVLGVWMNWNLSILLVSNVALWLVLQVVISYYKNKNVSDNEKEKDQEWII